MPTDFERDLSKLLHTVTPEPPDHLASPRVAALPEARQADADADVIELVTQTGHAVSRPHWRWPAFVAAAAVAALAAGVVTLIQTGSNGHHPATGHSAAAGPTTNSGTPMKTSSAAAVPWCDEQRQLVSIAGAPLAWHGHPFVANTGTYRFGFRNRWANPCALRLKSVEIGRDVLRSGIIPAADAAFHVSIQKVEIPGHWRVAYTARFRVTGRCETDLDGNGGLAFYVDLPHLGSIQGLGVTGCTLTPVLLTHRVVG